MEIARDEIKVTAETEGLDELEPATRGNLDRACGRRRNDRPTDDLSQVVNLRRRTVDSSRTGSTG